MEKFTEQLKALSERTLNLKDTLNDLTPKS